MFVPFGQTLTKTLTTDSQEVTDLSNIYKTHAGLSTEGRNANTPTATIHMSAVSAEIPIMPLNAASPAKNRLSSPNHSSPRCQTNRYQTQNPVHAQTDNRPVTHINISTLAHYLTGYPKAHYLIGGFQKGFRLGYTGPRVATMSPNLASCAQHPQIVEAKLTNEIKSGRIKGTFSDRPFPTLQVSPFGLVPKKTPHQYRLVHHLSYPKGKSVNDYIDPNFSTVQYASFDDAVAAVLELCQGCYLANTDIDNAFRLVPIHVHVLNHDLLGFTFKDMFYYDTCLPMGSSSSCFIFECFSTGLQWISQEKLGIQHMVHILDDFLILGPPNSSVCQLNLQRFLQLCSSTGVPTKPEKTVCTSGHHFHGPRIGFQNNGGQVTY
jgi:hypothetical protein